MNVAEQLPDFMRPAPTQPTEGYCPQTQEWTTIGPREHHEYADSIWHWWTCGSCGGQHVIKEGKQ